MRTGSWVAVAAAFALVSGCTASPSLHATGRVDDSVDRVVVPAVLAVSPNVNAGFSPTPSVPVQPAPVPAVRVLDAVAVGTHVSAGDAVAHLDASALDAAVDASRADSALADARIALLLANRDDVVSKRADLKTKRSDVLTALDKLADARATLLANQTTLRGKQQQLDAQLAALRTKRAQVATTIASLTAQRDALAATPDSPARTAGLAKLDAALTQAKAGLAQLDAGLKQATAGAAQLASGLAQIETGLATVASNRAKATDGLTKIDDGLAKLDDASTTLTNAHELAVISSRGAKVAVARAEQQRTLATLIAPADGVVTATSQPGDVLAPGASVVTIRPDAAASVTVWVAPGTASRLCAGSDASVRTDWGATYPATVARIGVRADYPPTSQATDDIHLTRAVAVTLTLAAGAALPPGAPVDLTLSTCKEN